jgi:hypothetical protein
MLSIKDIAIDAELESLLPPLSDDENVELLKSIQRDGFTDPIIVWLGHNILVDGHNRHRIWTTTGMSEDDAPEIIEKQFADRDAVKDWMRQRALARRNLNDATRVKIALDRKPYLQAKAKQNKPGPKPANSSPNSATISAKVDVREEIAKSAGVAHDTVNKVETVLAKADESTKAAMLSGEKSINKAYVETVKPESKAPAKQPEPRKWEQGVTSLPDVQEHAPEDDDSDTLFTLKSYWRKASKKDRKAFLEWAKQ